jgi:hypothetical protein
MRDDLVSTSVAAVHCHLSPRTLEKRRVRGGGPPYHKLGRLVWYSLRDLDDWIASGRRLSTCDPGGGAPPAAPGAGGGGGASGVGGARR